MIDDEQVAEEGDPQQYGIEGAAFGEQMLDRECGKVLVRWHRKLLRTVELALASEAIEQRRDRVRPVSAIDEIADQFRQHENRDRQQDQRQHAAENEKSLPTEV